MSSQFPTMRFLCAEDNALSAELLQRVLEKAITVFKITDTLRETMIEAQKSEWDVVLLDLRLLDSDADQTVDAIHSIKRLANAPLIVVSGMSGVTPNLKERCLAAGADGFVEKNIAHSIASNALRIAVIAATLHHPSPKDSDVMDKVRILEELVKAAAA